MSRSSYLFAGIFGSFAVSCFALVLVPQMQLGGLQANVDEENNDVYPVNNPRQGRRVYLTEGCQYCHSQQVRDPQYGTDLERGWGPRRSVARDYFYENEPALGTSRLGPDLANVGGKDWRNEDKDDPRKPVRRDAAWHYLHLYNPRAVVTESNMPPYRYLFTKRKITGQRSNDALNVDVENGFEIVPKAAAMHLVAYLRSLDRGHPLPEVKGESTVAGETAAGGSAAPATAAPAAAAPAPTSPAPAAK
jgi:cytochrome c oxidase cbb3-type subunit 2